jgi:hypothetical protein
MESNILSGGLDEINKIKEAIIVLNGYKDKNDTLNSDEIKIEKSIKLKEKAISDEILSTTKKRKEEIDATYNDQIEKIRIRIKKIRGKKEKSKHKKVLERIETETAELREEHRQLVLDNKSIIKQNKIPSFCNSKLFFSLYLPKGTVDIFIIIMTLALILLVIPCVIYFLLLPEENMIYLISIYATTVLICGGTYMIIDNTIKDKKKEALLRIRTTRDSISMNKKKRNLVKRRILKDKDESLYGLENFNKELQELENELNSVIQLKNDALMIFENTTRFVISEEIKGRYQEELSNEKMEYTKIYQEIKQTEDLIKNLAMEIANKYEVYLGKEFMSLDKLDRLSVIIKDRNVSTISEAIALFKEETY